MRINDQFIIIDGQELGILFDRKIYLIQTSDFYIFSIQVFIKQMNRTAKKSSRERKSIDKISTTNSTIRFKEILDRNVVKLNSNVYLDKKSIFNPSKKTNQLSKKIKSAINTPKNTSTIKMKSPKKIMKQNFYVTLFRTQKNSPVSTPMAAMEEPKRKLTRNLYNFIYQIGSGGFGSVWKVKDKQNHQIYAMKQISKAKVIMKKSVNSVINQKILLDQMTNPFIINAVQSFQDREHLYLVMQYLRGGDLRYHLCYYQNFNQKQTKFIVACIVQSLSYVHSKGIIHRDLKPQNLVFQQNGYLRLTDFGVARKRKQNNSQQTSGTPGYMSPQVICRMNHSFQSDYFALGVIIYQIVLGRRPYMGDSRKQIRDKILAHQAKISTQDLASDWSTDCIDFVNRLLKRNKESRLGYNGIDEIKNHPWMKSINWKKLASKELLPPFSPGVVSESLQYQKEMQNSEETQLDEETVILLRTPEIQNLFKEYENSPQKTIVKTSKPLR